jgi:hypothetical protein
MEYQLNDSKLPIRFWNKVKHNTHTGCWEWQGEAPHGYGRVSSRGKSVLAHRFAYQAIVGEIPQGLVLDHVCRVRSCVNPGHLEAVTPGENSRRSPLVRKMVEESAAERRSRTHCPKGHEYSGTNLIVNKNNQRICRECRRQANRDHYLRNAESMRSKSRAYHAEHRAERNEKSRMYYHAHKTAEEAVKDSNG